MLMIISSGYGPVECENAVFRYVSFLEEEFYQNNIKYKYISRENGLDKNTCKSVTLEINSNLDFLQKYIGTILWVNQSEYRKNHKRKNWYIKAHLSETLDDHNSKSKVSLDKKDIFIETMRSSGNGGQNINKLETAVRIKHIKTGITVVSKEERTQYQNKKIAMKKLLNKLQELEEEQINRRQVEIWEAKSEIKRGEPEIVFKGEKFKKIK